MKKGVQRIRTRAQRKERARRAGDPHPGQTLQEIRERQWTIRQLIIKHGGKCVSCGVDVTRHDPTDPTYATIDHIVPLSVNGTDHISNKQLMCSKCNGKKNDTVLLTFEPEENSS